MNALWEFDQSAFRAVQGMRAGWLDPILQGVTITGLGWVQILLIIALFVDWKNLRRGSWSRHDLVVPLVAGYLVSGAVNALLKHFLDRDRPSNFAWVDALEDVHYHSFSSGHTASSFGIAMTLFWLTRGTPRAMWGRWALVWAAWVGFSRVYVGVHWPTDIVSGTCVGILCGTWLSWALLNRKEIHGKNLG